MQTKVKAKLSKIKIDNTVGVLVSALFNQISETTFLCSGETLFQQMGEELLEGATPERCQGDDWRSDLCLQLSAPDQLPTHFGIMSPIIKIHPLAPVRYRAAWSGSMRLPATATLALSSRSGAQQLLSCTILFMVLPYFLWVVCVAHY